MNNIYPKDWNANFYLILYLIPIFIYFEKLKLEKIKLFS